MFFGCVNTFVSRLLFWGSSLTKQNQQLVSPPLSRWWRAFIVGHQLTLQLTGGSAEPRGSRSQLISVKPKLHLFTVSPGARVTSFPSAGNHVDRCVRVHICAADGAQGKSRMRTVLVSLQRLCLSPGGSAGRLLGASAKCGKAEVVLFAAGSPLSDAVFCSLSHPFSPILSSLEQINLTELKFRCSSPQLIQAAVTRVSCWICLWLCRHGNSFK